MEGKALRERRNGLGLTQEGLAKALGTTANTIARWERGEVSIPPYLELALKQLKSEKKKAA